jgi:predicted RNase H-like HicB family nuclease
MPRAEPFPYRIEVLYSNDDECYVARVPSLRGCSAHSDSLEGAAAEAHTAALAMIEVTHSHGDHTPPPDWARTAR